MSLSRARETVFQVLCALDLSPSSPKKALSLFNGYAALSEDEKKYAESLLTKVFRFRQKLDALYKPHLKRWKVSRLATVDRNLLRIALHEIFYGDVPPPVAIHEVLELAKRYGNEQSPSFIHGILGSILKKASRK